MLIEQPPRIFRSLFRGAIFRPGGEERRVFLTFDDGPVPEATPFVLAELQKRDIKATFFMVGDNARKYPALVEEVRKAGHCIGNHSMHHLQGLKTPTDRFIADIQEADSYLSSPWFRPPHGLMRPAQLRRVKEIYRVVMYDLVTRDYSRRLSPEDVVNNVKRFTRPGSIIVFHDSVKALPRLRTALPEALDWLSGQGYSFACLDDIYPQDQHQP